MNVTILNLPRTTTQKELINLFAQYGKIEACNIVMDNKTGLSKGFGFVEMLNDEEANAAITSLNNSNFGGKRIRVKTSNKTKE